MSVCLFSLDQLALLGVNLVRIDAMEDHADLLSFFARGNALAYRAATGCERVPYSASQLHDAIESLRSTNGNLSDLIAAASLAADLAHHIDCDSMISGPPSWASAAVIAIQTHFLRALSQALRRNPQCGLHDHRLSN
jgi:hypothetical protein